MQSLRNLAALPRCAIVAMGVSGCGKSTLIEHLAARFDCPAFEGDDFHAAASIAKMRAGQPLDDADRWPWLDRLGAAIGTAVIDNGVALAACSALKRTYRDRLRAADPGLRVIYLDGEAELIARRMAARPGHFFPTTLLDQQLNDLEKPGPDEHPIVVPIGLSPELAVDAIVAALAR